MAAAAQASMQQKIDSEEVRQLESFDLALAHIIEMPLHERRRQMLEDPRVNGLRARDDADVGGVTLVPGTRKTQTNQRHANHVFRLQCRRLR